MRTVIYNAPRERYNPFVDRTANLPEVRDLPFEEALVVDIVLNDDHPEYAEDGYNVGAAKIRLLKSNYYRSDETLTWAFPLESNISDYPLKDEIVIVYSHLDRLYYSRKVNASNKVTTHTFLTLNDELQPALDKGIPASNINSSRVSPSKIQKAGPKGKFQDLLHVFRLWHDEGDFILEGRSGHSIRFGTSWTDGKYFKSTEGNQAPNLLIRVGPSKDSVSHKDVKYGVVTEDINEDKTSLWMVSDQLVDLDYSTSNSPAHAKSPVDFPTQLDKNQVILNTDRIVLNTKTGKLIGSVSDGIHWMTTKDITSDAARDSIFWIGRDQRGTIRGNERYDTLGFLTKWVGGAFEIGSQRMRLGSRSNLDIHANSAISLVAPRIYVGSVSNTAQPIPLGQELTSLLVELLTACISSAGTFAITGLGPAVLNPSIVQTMTRLRTQLQQGRIISNDNFVNKTNASSPSPLDRLQIHDD